MIRFWGNSAQKRQVAIISAGGLLAVLFVVCAPVIAAPHSQIRIFNAKIDNKPAGLYTMSITESEKGAVMTGDADLSVRMYLVKTYTYRYKGTETWKGNRLQELKSHATDDGKSMEVVAWATVDGLMVWSDGKQRPTKGDAWTTTYWRLPDPALRNGLIHLLDADTGRDLYGSLQLIDWQELTVTGQKQKCSHYRLTGEKLNVELWYDAGEHLVREKLVEDGHTLVLELMSIR